MDKPQAVGSIWNVNSWHWEMKNYSERAKAILEQKILSLQFQASADLKIKHKKVKFIKSECEVNIRKGKQIPVYDFEVELEVQGQHQAEDDAQGSYRVREILSDDLNDMIIDEIKTNEKNKAGEEMKKWIKKNVKARLIEVFKHLQEELAKAEGDPEKLQEDKRKREENLAATQKAREEKGAQKERLLQEQKEKERRLREQAYQKNLQQAIKDN